MPTPSPANDKSKAPQDSAGAVLAPTGHAAVAGRAAIAAALAAAGASVHGRAARRASNGGPICAMDVANALPATIGTIAQSGQTPERQTHGGRMVR